MSREMSSGESSEIFDNRFGKVIYFKDPMNLEKKIITRVLPYEKTLYQLLKRLGIHDRQLNIVINEVENNYLSLNHKINVFDSIVIKNVLQGGGSARGTWGTVVNIAGIIGSIALAATGQVWTSALVATAASSVGGGLSASAERRRQRSLLTKQNGLPNAQDNGFGLTAAQNAATPMAPIPLIFGETNFAPPIAAPPHSGNAGGKFEAVQNAWPSFFYGTVPIDDWMVVPKGFFFTSPYNWPAYDLKVYPFVPLIDFMSFPATWHAYLANTYDHSIYAPESQIPTLCYHHDPNDPLYGYYDLWGMQAIFGILPGGSRPANQIDFINQYKYVYGGGPRPSWFDVVANFSTSGGPHNYDRITFNIGPNAPLTIKKNDVTYNIWDIVTGAKNIVFNTQDFPGNWAGPTHWHGGEENLQWFFWNHLNQEYPVTTPPAREPNVPARLSQIDLMYSQPRVLDLNQVFNLGFGDIEVLERKLGGIEVSKIKDSATLDVYKPTASFPPVVPNPDGYANFHLGIKTLDASELRNPDNDPNSAINPFDSHIYNFVYRASPKDCELLYLDFVGRLFKTDPEQNSGTDFNQVSFELHIKDINDPDFNSMFIFNFRNDGVDIIRRTFVISINPKRQIEFRIRKMDYDQDNNETPFTCDFSVAFRCQIAEPTVTTDLRAQNLNALYLRSTSNSLSETQGYVQTVGSKMRYYDYFDDTWKYGITRNPAFHLLFVLRGGFLNQHKDGSDPSEPTIWWTNNPEDPNNLELLFGAGLPDSRIDIDSIVEWGRFCELNEFYFDHVFLEDMNVHEMLSVIASSGRAVVDTFRGKHSVRWRSRDDVVTGVFGMSNIIAGSFSVNYNSNPLPEKIRVTYVNRDNDFESEQFEVDLPTDVKKEPRITEISLQGITTPAHAMREARLAAAEMVLYNKVYSWQTDKEGLIFDIFDLVYGSHDATEYSKSGRAQSFKANNKIKTNMILDKTFIGKEILMRLPDGALKVLDIVDIDGQEIEFTPALTDEELPSEFMDGSTNEDSDFEDSTSLDYILTAGFLGKKMRIVGIEPSGDDIYQITAIDDDDQVWAFEEGEIEDIINPQSQNDSIINYKVRKFRYFEKENKIYFLWSGVDQIKFLNLDTNSFHTENGRDVFSGGRAILNLPPGRHDFDLVPNVLGLDGIENKRVTIWV